MSHLLAIVSLVFLASSALGSSRLGSTALLVEEPDDAVAIAALDKRLTDDDPRVRAAAARVVNVRRLTTLLTAIKTALANETSPEAAREQVRAIGILAEPAEIAFLFEQIKRFDGRLDGVLATAIARRGGAQAIELYDSYVTRLASLGDSANFFQLAFWGRPQLVTPTASRLLGRKDARGWIELFNAIQESDTLPPIGVTVAALNMEDDTFRVPTAWHLARALACEGELPGCRSDFSKHAREVLFSELKEESPPASPPEFRFARELLRRILAVDPEPRESAELRQWLSSDEATAYLAPSDPLLPKYLTRAERIALEKGAVLPPFSKPDRSHVAPAKVSPPAFRLPTELPNGVASAILAATKCHATWIGVARAAVDASGRVSSVDVSAVETSRECRRALAMIAKLSLPTNHSLTSSRSDVENLLFVRGGKADPCLDEPDVSLVPEETGGVLRLGRRMGGGDVKAPIVLKRVEPYFSEAGLMRLAQRGRSAMVLVESTITRAGCVRDIRLVEQSFSGDLNRAAILAVSQWTFEPGKLDGKPVDVIFNLTVNYKLK